MSNEIQYRHTTGRALYATLRDANGAYRNVASGLFETLGAWGDHDHAMTETAPGSYLYVASAPPLAAGVYAVDIFERAGASPASSDMLIASGQLAWDGSAEITPAALGDIAPIRARTDALPDDPAREATVAGIGAAILDEQVDGVALSKLLQVLLAVAANKASFDATTGVWTVKARDGQTTLLTVTQGAPGNRTESVID